MTPSFLMSFLIAALSGGAVAYLLIRPIAKRFAQRLEDLIPDAEASRKDPGYEHLVELCHSLSERVEELERRQEFSEELSRHSASTALGKGSQGDSPGASTPGV